ncbi:hypothetical protein J437_LFUL012603 [Ladona fulva]|uniref:Programmed cell death protein 10 dimerisation domain-containing protein n=1 Tax=Ladona fulva TaxID=123851 RepID=A0A8K0KE32_LADFU|nr:hypothetical protein J437_LFUL012603 [Ladona fulva]
MSSTKPEPHYFFLQLERIDFTAAVTLRSAICKVESSYPGFAYDFIVGILRRGDLGINMNESILRLQGTVSSNSEIEVRRHLSRIEDSVQELNRKSTSLKRILSRIPDEISDRKTFLETIKEIASAIKKLLDAVNEVATFIPGPSGKQALEQRKREFVKYSKRFSNTLKEYFKEGQYTYHNIEKANAVFVSALYLIHQTNMIMSTVRDICEKLES